jgi:hypothetical protein
MVRLWGENYFNPKTKKWSTSGTDDDGKLECRAKRERLMLPKAAKKVCGK